ncbi:HAD-like protein [Rhizoclosmatium globosum]|uniref:HAD-like protein n=1 Tax=Rhizoclosmatium globosum TaxID=329046 RepID=A0A1Y2C4E6_9FUNG|nr:HAD-like protein [Rhizoclosmatium globosum]|eukprot:ORY41891.1 HAD-like protein [Rhizoclosmatium globosum]
MPTPVTHVLFDMDGLLLDTERVYSEVTNAILARFGKTFDWSVKSRMMGAKERDAANILIEAYGTQCYARIKVPRLQTLPGVLRLIKHLKESNVPICVATSSHRKAFELKSSKNGELFGLFDGNITCGDDAQIKKGKPAPDIFLAGAKSLGFNAATDQDYQKCLVFEDAPSGVLAGLNAGMQVVWIPDSQLELDPELVKRCAKVLKSMEDFDPAEFGLPSYN